MKEKENIEAEIEAIVEELNSPGPNGAPPPGLKGNLVDREGFPRADVDVYNIRLKRNRLACLQTDHKELMKKIEDGLAEYVHPYKINLALSVGDRGSLFKGSIKS